MLPLPVATPPPILKHWIYLANREPERAKDEDRNHLWCRSISTRVGDLRGQGEGTKVKTTKTSGGWGALSYTSPRNIHKINNKWS